MDSVRGAGQGPAGSLARQMRYFLQAVREVRSGLAGEKCCETQTTLNYKLDLDERGVLKSASPKDSIRAVTSQEQMNARRLSAEALARGEDVVSVDVDYKSAIVDGKLAITAGHTEVVSKPRADGITDSESTAAGPPASPEESYRAIGEANKLASMSLGLPGPGSEDAALRSFSAPE